MKAKHVIFLCVLILTFGCQNPFGSNDADKVSIDENDADYGSITISGDFEAECIL